MADDLKDLEKFIDKVDDIQSIITGLNVEDPVERKQWEAKADIITSKSKKSHDNTGVNRSVINQKAFDDVAQTNDTPQQGQQEVSQDAFMSAIEQDAQERHARKQVQREEANKIKEIANEQFKTGNYEGAIELYSEALTHAKDITALWTNRAQAYIKLGKYKEALIDCDWALRVFENCLKAYIHQGRAYLGLKQYDKALDSYKKALEVEPNKTSVINEYIEEVEHAQNADNEERAAQEIFNSGQMSATTVIGVLEKLQKLDQLPLFYSGGLRLLVSLIKDTSQQTLFRTNGGINLIVTHHVISRCFKARPKSLSREEFEVVWSSFDVLTSVCSDNEENQRLILDTPDFAEHVLKFLEVTSKRKILFKESCVNLLNTLSQSKTGRSRIMMHFDIKRLLAVIFTMMREAGLVAVNSAGVLNNIALDAKFKSVLLNKLEEDFLPAFEDYLVAEQSNSLVLQSLISTVTNLTCDVKIRKKVNNRKSSWLACLKILDKYSKHDDSVAQDILYVLLGLLVNLTTEISPCDISKELCSTLSDLLLANKPSLSDRALTILSQILPHSKAAVDVACDKQIPVYLIQQCQCENQSRIRSSIKALAGCTSHSQIAKTAVLQNKGLSQLVELMKLEDENILGNTALCLGHLTEEPKVSSKLAKTNIIQHLLVLARDGRKKAVQQNSAILIAKLARADERHLERLRQLDGLGILHDCMRYIDT